jgi:tRNA A37 N6-isopentenylltransferase MiaA
MNTPVQNSPSNFDEDFMQALDKWKAQHNLRDDDSIFLLLDLFRIHQSHWDEIRHRQMPSLDEFKADIAVLAEATKTLKERTKKEIHSVEFPTAIMAVIAASVAGYLIGKFL